MQAGLSLRWKPKNAFAPALQYLSQPARILRAYDPANLRPDLLAALTLTAVMLPQAIAYSLLAGLPPQMGLYSAIVGAVAGALWGSSRQMYTGPTNALSLLVFSTLSLVAAPGSDQYIIAAGLMALMAGVFQIALGLVRLGVLINFVSHSVIIGFATGAGVLIIIKQLGPIMGIQLPGPSIVNNLVGAATLAPTVNLPTLMLGLLAMAIIIVLRRVNPRLPGAAIAILATSVIVYVFNLEAAGVDVVGKLPSRLPPLAPLPIFDLDLIGNISTGALAVAAIGLVQAAAVSRSVAMQTGQRLDNNQEFVGQGFANSLAGLFSGYACTGSFAATAVNYRAGGQTALASVFSSLLILLVVLVGGSFTAYLPVSALAGTLIVIAIGMIDRKEIGRIWQGAPGDAIIMVVTFLGTLFLRLEFAVLAGILLSFALYILRTSAPRVQPVLPDESFRHFTYQPNKDLCPQLGVIEILGDLYFGAVNYVEEVILDMRERHPEQRYLLIRMHHVNQIDFSGIHALENVIRTYRERGGDVFFVRVGYRVRRLMESTGCSDYIGRDNFLEEDKAIDYLFHHVLDPAVCIYECPIRAFKECQNLPKRYDLIDRTLPLYASRGAAEGVVIVEPRALWDKLRRDPGAPPLVVDVREPREFRQAHVAEAVSAPLLSLLEGEIALEQGRPIVLICRSGRRSRRAAQFLLQNGYSDVQVLQGGMAAWEAAGLLEAVSFEPVTDDGYASGKSV